MSSTRGTEPQGAPPSPPRPPDDRPPKEGLTVDERIERLVDAAPPLPADVWNDLAGIFRAHRHLTQDSPSRDLTTTST